MSKMVKKSSYPDVIIPELSLSDHVFSCISKFEDAIALVDHTENRSITYRSLHEKCVQCTTFLKTLGIGKGDVVALFGTNCIEYPILMLAISACGATITTCNPEFTEGELGYQIDITKTRVIFTNVKTSEVLKKVAERSQYVQNVYAFPDEEILMSMDILYEGDFEDGSGACQIVNEDIVLIASSSGTTGLPKGLLHTHHSLISSLMICANHLEINSESRFYNDRPMFYMGGFLFLLTCLQEGVKFVFNTIDGVKEMLGAVEHYKITHSFCVPAMLKSLSQGNLHKEYDTSSLQQFILGGAAAAPHLIPLVEDLYQVKAIPVYGLSEFMPISWGSPAFNDEISAGEIAANTLVKIIHLTTGDEVGAGEDGEILAKGPQMMKCYINNPEATANTIDEHGWMHTGDIGHYNIDGALYVVARKKELIKYNTLQIPPAELEAVLLKHPKISDAGVIGVPHSPVGELPKAFVVKKDPTLTAEEVKRFIEEKLSDHKHLRGGVSFVDRIPRTISGKILRRELRKKGT